MRIKRITDVLPGDMFYEWAWVEESMSESFGDVRRRNTSAALVIQTSRLKTKDLGEFVELTVMENNGLILALSIPDIAYAIVMRK
jgi:hypothetical protein